MYHVDAENVDELWGLMAPGLARALDKTALGLTWGLGDGYEAVKSGELFGFYQPHSGYSGLYMLSQTPKARLLYWFWSGKHPDNNTPLDDAEVVSYLNTAAKIFECKYIQAEGRPGFKVWANAQGFIPDSHNWLREVTI